MLDKFKKKHAVYIGLILLLTFIFLNSIISTSKIMSNIHHINDVTFISQNLKESLLEYGQLHLWTPYYYSGRPLYAQPEYYFLDFNFLYILIFKNIFVAMNLATLTYFFLSGLGMYFLFLTFKDNRKGAFIAAVLYMFNGYVHSFVINANLNVLAGYSLIPFAFMFFVKALQSKNFVKNSILSGLFIALQLFAGGTLLVPYEIVLFAIYSMFYLLGKDFSRKLLKIAAVVTLVILVSFGVSAIKLLPGIEFMSLSNRGSGLSYQEYLGEPIQLSNLPHIIVTNLISNGISASVGIMGFILLIFSLYNYKKRYVIFSLALLIFSILMAVQGQIADLFFKFPVFSQLRHIERGIVLTALASSILGGAGFVIFSEKVKRITKIKKEIVIFSGILLLILIELLFLQPFPKSMDIVDPKNIEINNFISNDNEKFRTINLALSTLVGASGYNHLAQLGIGTIKGGSGIWFNDYLGYLSVAQQTNPARLWGLLNNKYVLSDKEVDISGLKFIDEFEKCKGCTIWEVSGPYLYENLEFMPRAYIVDKAILVIGDQQNADSVSYTLILDKNFDPKKAVIVHGKRTISQNNLKRYNAIIIAGTIENDEINALRNYVDNGGILLPNIFENKNTVNEEDIAKLFIGITSNFEEIEILEYESNKAVYNVRDKKGFLVLSERFSNFPDWEAIGGSNKEILKANVIATAVFVENEEKITLEYKPQSFKNGSIISSITALLIIIYFITSNIKKYGGKNKS